MKECMYLMFKYFRWSKRPFYSWKTLNWPSLVVHFGFTSSMALTIAHSELLLCNKHLRCIFCNHVSVLGVEISSGVCHTMTANKPKEEDSDLAQSHLLWKGFSMLYSFHHMPENQDCFVQTMDIINVHALWVAYLHCTLLFRLNINENLMEDSF